MLYLSVFFSAMLSLLLACPSLAATWTTGAPMPTARASLAAAAINGKLYAIGGDDGNNYLNTLEVYDSVTNTWTTGPPMPTPRMQLAVTGVGSKLYVMGGRNEGYESAIQLITLEVYNQITNTWVTQPSLRFIPEGMTVTNPVTRKTVIGSSTYSAMPAARYQLAVVTLDGNLYAVGGWDASNNGLLSRLDICDSADTFVWDAGPPMSRVRCALAAAAINGKLYAVGGWRGKSALDTLEILTP